MKLSSRGIEVIKYYEGVKKQPYRCPAGLWTIGVGHLIGDGSVLPSNWNRTFTIGEIDALLAKDVARFERGVSRLCPVSMSQGVFDGLVCFSFNLGLGALQRSTVRQKINRGDTEGAVKSLLKYNKASGKVMQGLTNRRKSEAALMLS